jgi:hypothetical protein
VWFKDRSFAFDRFISRDEPIRGGVVIERRDGAIQVWGYIDDDHKHHYDSDIPLGKVDKLIKAWGKVIANDVVIVGVDPGTENVDCRVCSEGTGLCAECIAAADHVVTHRDGDFELDTQPTINCSCGWSHEYPRGGSDVAEDAVAAAIKAHWQNVVTEANAAAESIAAPESDPLDIPACLRRAPAEAAE